MTATPDPFSARDTLEAGGRDHVVYRLDAVRDDLAPHPVHDQGAAGERAAQLRARLRDRGRRAGAGGLAAQLGLDGRGALPARARGDAGLHRRPVRGRPRGDARRHGRAGRRPGPDQPAGAGRPGDRPLGAGRPLRRPRRVRGQRRARVRAQRRALHAAALGPAGLRRLPHRPARHRDRAPGEPGVPVAGGPGARGRRRAGRLPRHPRRHRLAHDHDQRPRGAGLRRRRHRGRGRAARPAAVAADPDGHRAEADRPPRRRRHRHRPGADGHRDAAGARRGGQVRGALRRRPLVAEPRRPGHDLEHVAGVRRHRHDVPDRRRDAALHGDDRPARRRRSRWPRPTPRSRACSAPTTSPDPEFDETLELDLGSVEPSLAGPRRPQDRVALGRRGRASSARPTPRASSERRGPHYPPSR